ncbi:MAG: pyruvate kinase [Deltaproteobacteria bacterium]|nr:MAG: pyruvate kinase [Deltaproteobacteria bacterium]
MRRTKIVCTVGPASNTKAKIGALVRAGMNCARLNFSHGDHESHDRMANLIRQAASEARRPLAILADMQGPKMRIGRFAQGPIELSPGDRFALTTDEVEGNQEIVSVVHDSLGAEVQSGDTIALDDGFIRLRVDTVEGNTVHTIVEDGGTLSDNKGLNLPGVSITGPAMTSKDRKDLTFAISELGADYIALSFVRSAKDVIEAKSLAGDVPVIAKIERPEAVAALPEIVEAADGIMIARGDLGVELGAEKVPLVQKRIIRETNARGKVVITATQMLDSMIRNPRPTRAEAADVANAVMDGTDAVMLSGETAAGRYPVQALEMMDAIIREVESDYVEDLSREFSELKSVGDEDWPFSNAAARAAAELTTHLPLKAVVVFTQDGRSAGLLAEHRPRAPILAVTSDVRVARRLALEWGVIPRIEVPPESLDETLRIATSLLVREQLCQRGEAFAMVVGWPTSGRTNTLKLHRL